MFKKEIINLLSKQVPLKKQEIANLIEVPPSSELGDYAFPCFSLAGKLKKNPVEIAKDIAKKLQPTKTIQEIKVSGPYINFFINQQELAKHILMIDAHFGKQKNKTEKIIIDFSGPNIGKPMHVGHIRSTVLGDSLLRTYNFLGYKTIGINYLGDIGLHIGKLIVAYELWLDKKKLKKDPVEELLRLYLKFNAEEKSEYREGLEEEFQDNEWTNKAKEKLKLLELGDKKTHIIWKDIQKYSKKGFDRIYSLLNVDFHETVGQSLFSEKGKKIIMEALKKGLAKIEDDGAVYVKFKDMPKKYVLRSNQTASYITQDMGAAVERSLRYRFDKMIYVTDFRQQLHFKQLFEILKKFGYNFSDKLIHVGFGTVNFGKEIMATRKGKIILLEDVLKKTIEKAKEEIKKRKTKGDAETVGVGAIKYAILKINPAQDVNFSWQQALNFEGDSGPYLQYAYARASSILRKAKKSKTKPEINKLKEQETALIKEILQFPEIVEKASQQLNPSLLANYSFQLAQIFNEFYHSCPVIKSREATFRLRLVESFRITIKNSLYLLGIEVMEEM